MYIDFVPNRGSKPTILRRESIREGKRIRKRTIANLSALTLEQAEAIRLVLKGEQLAPAGGSLECIRSLPHGHVEAVRIAMRPKNAKPGTGTFTLATEANPKQRQALDLAATIAA